MKPRLSNLFAALLLLTAAFGATNQAAAQLSGTITVPNSTYPTLASVVSALNAQGVGAGGVIVNLTASETAPAGGYRLGSLALNITTSATQTITINGGGNTLSAAVGTGTIDALFMVRGTDYVTINSLDLAESASNTTAATQMEAGYSLLKLSTTDGCQNVTISGCTVTLNRSNAASVGILQANRFDTSTTTTVTVTAASGAASNNSFTGNTIQNVYTGVSLSGFAAATPFALYDQNNVVRNNTVQNFGGGTTTSYGVYLIYQNDPLVYNNTINNIAGGGIASGGTIYGIYHSTSTNASSTLRRNTVTLTQGSNTSTYYLIQCAASGGTTVNVDSNRVRAVSLGSSSVTYGLYVTGVATNCNINANILDSFSTASTGFMYLIYPTFATPAGGVLNINDNKITNYVRTSASGGMYGIYQTGSAVGGVPVNIRRNKFDNITYPTTSSASLYAFYIYGGASPYPVRTAEFDTVQNVVMGAGTFYGMYTYNCGAGSAIRNNLFNNITTGSTHYTLYLSSSTIDGTAVNDNVITGIINTSTSSSTYNLYLSGATNTSFYRNRITNIQSAITTAAALYPMYFAAGTDVMAYNNAISDIRTPAGGTVSPIYGMYFSAGTSYRVYHNTINLNPVSTGAIFGATGIYYASGITSFDLRNNIVRVNATPAGTGFVVALRRSTGTAGTPPANLASGTNGNIYWVPTATNAWLYGEGSTAAAMVNTYNLTNDPSFNTPCGLYKIFMSPREGATFTENNLAAAGTAPGVFAPTGTSYAQNNGVPTTNPAVTTDFYNATRGTLPDVGAVEFTGTGSDAAGPIISYTALTTPVLCTAAPSFTATITDASGVNIITGTRPRLYYKKSTEANAFGGANNSTFNGWKWVEATGAGPAFTFSPDYSLLTAPVATGNVIQYFVVAQDNAATPNVSSVIAAYPSGFCPTSVALPAAAGPLAATPAPYSYTIGATPTAYTASASPDQICVSGDVTLSLNASSTGLAVQWQSATLAGTFSNISGATTAPYTLTGVSATTRYRAVISCGGTLVTTTNEDTVVVQSPSVVSTSASAAQCGGGTFTLNATGSAGTILNWYAAAAGGAPLGTGGTFTTPFISATTNFYVGATAGGSVQTLGKVTPVSTNGNSGFSDIGLVFDAFSNFTIQTVDVYAIGTTPSTTGTITVALKNSAGTTLQTASFSNVTVTTGGTTVTVLPLNFAVTPGTSYRLVVTAAGSGISNLIRESVAANINYPYTLPGVASITSAYTSGASAAYYYYFYNWQLLTGCESPRTAVAATVTPPATANATASGPTSICQGSPVTLNATPIGAGFNYQWLLNGTPIPGATSPSYSANQTGSYTVSVFTTPACNDTSNTPIVVTVAAVPIGISPTAPVTLCAGGSQVLTGPSGTGLSYQWLLNNAIIPGANSQNYTATATGLYRVRVTTSNNCSDTSQPVSINVVASPPATITASGSLNICPNVGVVLSGPTNSSLSYQWYFNSTAILGATGQTYTALAAGQYTLRTQVTSATCSTFSSPVVVTTASLPPTAFSASNGGNICAGSTVTLTGPVDLGYTYQWLLNGAPIAGANGQTYTTSVAGAYRLKVMAFSTGCIDTSGATTLTVRPLPAATTTPVGSGEICFGTTRTLTANAGTGLSYQWLYNTAPIAGATTQNYAAAASGQYSVRVTSSFGCANTSSPYTLTVRPKPPGQISYTDPLQFCAGGAVVLTAAGGVPGFVYQYQWYRDGVALPGTNTAFLQVTQAGAYTLQAQDSLGCQASSPAVTVTVNPTPGVAITAAGSVLSATPAFYQQYQWFRNNVAIAGANGPTYTATQNGSYRVEVIDGNGCLGLSTTLYLSNTGIAGAAPTSAPIVVYPNPTSSMLRIEAPLPVNAYLRNSLGQTVLVEKDATSMDVARFPDGLYTLMLTDRDGNVVYQEKVSKVTR